MSAWHARAEVGLAGVTSESRDAFSLTGDFCWGEKKEVEVMKSEKGLYVA